MSKRANPTLIGGFVLGAVILIVAAVLALGGSKLYVKRLRAVLFFPGSVQGLSIGSPVLSGGVTVGEVVDVKIRMDLADISVRVPVIIEIDPRKMELVGELRGFHEELGRWIERGLRGQLAIQSFVTGQLMVTLDLHPGTPVRLAGGYEGLPEIPTVPTPLEELSKSVADLPVGEIAERLASTLEGLSTTANSPQIPATLAEAQSTLRELRELAAELRKGLVPLIANAGQAVLEAKELARHSTLRIDALSETAGGTLEATRALLERAGARLDPLADQAGAAVGEIRELVRRVGARVDPVLGALEGAARDTGALARSADENLAPTLKSLREATGAAAAAFAKAEHTLDALARTANGDSAVGYEIVGALREVSKAARSVRVLADDLDEHPDALLRGKTKREGR
jgi:paraquat-inducible protein B